MRIHWKYQLFPRYLNEPYFLTNYIPHLLPFLQFIITIVLNHRKQRLLLLFLYVVIFYKLKQIVAWLLLEKNTIENFDFQESSISSLNVFGLWLVTKKMKKSEEMLVLLLKGSYLPDEQE